MVDKDVILGKIGVIKRCFNRIKDITGMNPEKLDDFTVQDVFVLNLQRAIQAVIGMGSHIIAENGYGLPDSMKNVFEILYDRKVIDIELCNKMKKMVAFRNIAVHQYQDIEIDILKNILSNNLGDIELFYKTIIDKLC